MMDWWTVLFMILSYFCVTLYNCNAQTITICENNLETTLNASDSENYIRSFNYPGDYTSTDNGDCKIRIYVNGSYLINITINGYIKRSSGNNLKFYDGIDDTSDILSGTRSLAIHQYKSYSSSGPYLYITHWSYGTTNDAFEIAYIAVEKSEDKDSEEEYNSQWILVFIPIGIFTIWMCISIHDKRRKAEEAARQAAQAQETQVNEKDPVTVQESGNTAYGRQIGSVETVEKDIVIDVPPPYVLSAEIRNPVLGYSRPSPSAPWLPNPSAPPPSLPNPSAPPPSLPIPSTPPPSYSSIEHNFYIDEGFNPSQQGYTPTLPDVERFPQPVEAAQYLLTPTNRHPKHSTPSKTKLLNIR